MIKALAGTVLDSFQPVSLDSFIYTDRLFSKKVFVCLVGLEMMMNDELLTQKKEVGHACGVALSAAAAVLTEPVDVASVQATPACVVGCMMLCCTLLLLIDGRASVTHMGSETFTRRVSRTVQTSSAALLVFHVGGDCCLPSDCVA